MQFREMVVAVFDTAMVLKVENYVASMQVCWGLRYSVWNMDRRCCWSKSVVTKEARSIDAPEHLTRL